ncbi:winged helix-turn-helix transcriptional regulator [Kitasatospora sp. SUK 42]|uniref:winged helix-turn-helix transcriptional regulator n=1 Tax=Kitasatospora sp. SUK 42 TaxID=1588882 RepID=UPI0018CAF3D7|nr:winged helix-turn-helix transcriptional regulator [Kitasatospora sp. SUK 42]MBV2152910.1 winged helix-turn-helix transcriptional regulator [Kitasatospora sp. SUK 42]
MTDEPGPAERALYLTAVRCGGRLRPEDLAPADRPTVAALVARGLLTPTATGYTAANPRALGDRLGAELRTRATRLLLNAERLPDALKPLTRAYEAVRRPDGPDRSDGQDGSEGPGGTGVSGDCAEPAAVDVVHLDTVSDIRQRVAELTSECKDELLAAQPGPRPLEGLRMTLAQDLSLLRRGCSMRTLYQPVTLADRSVLRQISLRTRQGAQVRVLTEPYERMLVFDRVVAVIPAAEGLTHAAFLTDPTTVSYLVAGFERDWARATPVDHHLTAPPPTTVRIGRLLARGLTQRAVATRLGLSERTVAAHISRLRELHDAETLFQLGWQMRGSRNV